MDDQDRRLRLTQAQVDKLRGIRCQKCGCDRWWTYRTVQSVNTVRRTKICRQCGNRIATVERFHRHEQGHDSE